MAKKNIPRLDEVFRFLFEGKCPKCGSNDAYVGFNAVECPNPKCQNFSEKQAAEVQGKSGGDSSRLDKIKKAALAQKQKSPGKAGNQMQPLDWSKFQQRGKNVWDTFSGTEKQYKDNITDALDDVLGHGWEGPIDNAYGPGSVDEMFRKLWKGNWTDSEGYHEFGFVYDNVQRGDVQTYAYAVKNPYPKEDWDSQSGTHVPRQKRPMKPDDLY